MLVVFGAWTLVGLFYLSQDGSSLQSRRPSECPLQRPPTARSSSSVFTISSNLGTRRISSSISTPGNYLSTYLPRVGGHDFMHTSRSISLPVLGPQFDLAKGGLKENTMIKHMTGTREEWLAARLELLKAEKELTRRSDELAQRRQELPWVLIAKDYRFGTDGGTASLADLFRGRSQLVVYHFMFGPGYTAGCPACSATADSFNGVLPHLEARDVT